MSTNTLEFTFTIDGATAVIELTKNGGFVYMTGLKTTFVMPPDVQTARATCLDWIKEIVARMQSAPMSVATLSTKYDPFDQTLAHVVAWTSKDLVTFKKYIHPLKFDIDKLREFVTVQKIQHILHWLQPPEKVIAMSAYGSTPGTLQYRITTTVKYVDGAYNATFDVNGALSYMDMENAITAINIIKGIIVGCDASTDIQRLRCKAAFDDAAFVYVAKLAKNPNLGAISASVRPGSVNTKILEDMVFD
jgi:hypothetical protein